MTIEATAVNGRTSQSNGEAVAISLRPQPSSLASTVSDTSRGCGAAQFPPSGLARARGYLDSHVADTVSLSQLARVAGLSKYYFLRAFNRAYGMTPHEYQMQLRLAHAQKLIIEGRALSGVAYDAGFADQSHLTRRFKRSFGVTPGFYRRQAAHGGHAA